MSHYSSYSREDWTTCGVIPQAQCHRTTKPPSNTHLTLAVKEFLVIELNDYIEMMENLLAEKFYIRTMSEHRFK